MPYIKSALVGLSLIGEAVSNTEQSFTILFGILTGQYDRELKCAMYMHINGNAATSDEDLETKNVIECVERLKSMCRTIVQKAFECANKEFYAEKEQANKQLLDRLKDSNKPHEMGTVAEIATKYGISKSEVRRRKAEGTLHGLQSV